MNYIFKQIIFSNVNESDQNLAKKRIDIEKRNTFLLNKNISDIPESYKEILEMVEVFKESYPNDIENVQITKGYVSNFNIDNSYSVNSTNIIGVKKIKKIFPDGKVPDKWNLSVKILITFKKFKNKEEKNLPKWAEDEIYDTSTIDNMIQRYKSVRTLSERCEYYGSNVKVSYGYQGQISLLIFFKQ